uniref:Uncharacterized protein n=1 Tax=Anopheles merus TaxID=30066 RepID=A0A182V5Y3_ANOME
MAGPHLEESTVTTPSITGGVVVNTASLSLSRPTNLESSICTIDDFLAHFKHKELENDVSKYLSHKQRPLCRRVLAYLRTAWMGAKFTSKSAKDEQQQQQHSSWMSERVANQKWTNACAAFPRVHRGTVIIKTEITADAMLFAMVMTVRIRPNDRTAFGAKRLSGRVTVGPG